MDHFPTPPRSTTDSSANTLELNPPAPSTTPDNHPSPAAPRTQGRPAKATNATYAHMIQLERDHVRKTLDRFLAREGKAALVAGPDRLAVLLRKRDEVLAKRVREGRGSARTRFPGLYDEAHELRLLRRRFGVYLDGDGRSEAAWERDVDDEEEMPVPGPGSGLGEGEGGWVKRERGAEIGQYLRESGYRRSPPRRAPVRGPARARRSYREESTETESEEEDQGEESGAEPQDYHREREPADVPVGISCQRSWGLLFGPVEARSFRGDEGPVVGVAVGRGGRRGGAAAGTEGEGGDDGGESEDEGDVVDGDDGDGVGKKRKKMKRNATDAADGEAARERGERKRRCLR